jgi:hypothetical protein
VQYVFENLATLLNLTETDILYQVGSNDGKVLISSCKQAQCRCVGIEVCESAVWKARDAAVRSMLLPSCIQGYACRNDAAPAAVLESQRLPAHVTHDYTSLTIISHMLVQ